MADGRWLMADRCNWPYCTVGGVSIFHNDALCYVDLMRFERVVVGNAATSVKYAQKPASCLGLECDAACTCT